MVRRELRRGVKRHQRIGLKRKREKSLILITLAMLAAWLLSGDKGLRVGHDEVTSAQLIWLNGADYVSEVAHGPDRDEDA